MSINRVYFTLLTSFHSFLQSSSLLLSSQAEIFTLRHSNILPSQSILFTPRIDPFSSIIFSCKVQTSPSIGRERNQPYFVPIDTYTIYIYIHKDISLSLSLRIFESIAIRKRNDRENDDRSNHFRERCDAPRK